ncbi:MAG: Kelch repeat-containing protein [Candidatus Limnocylindria bacterium]
MTRARLAPAMAVALLWASCTPAEPGAVVATSPAAPAPTTTTTAPPSADPATQAPAGMSWSRIPDIPTPRSEVAATLFDGHIYVIGGFGGLAVVERYDALNRRWERMPDLPIGVDHPMAASVDGPNAGVYVIGGNSGGRPSERVFRLAPGASAWQEVAPMPGPRSAGGAASTFLGSQGPEPELIVVIGGASGRGLEPATFVYDTVADAWSSRAPVPTPRDHLAVAWVSARICAVGGRTLSMARNLAAFECYDPRTDTWERMPAAPTARGGVGAAVAGKRLFFIGGEQPQGTFNEVEIYDLATGTWTRGPDLPTARHGIGVVAYNDQVFVMTGGPTPGGSQTAVCEVLTITAAR